MGKPSGGALQRALSCHTLSSLFAVQPFTIANKRFFSLLCVRTHLLSTRFGSISLRIIVLFGEPKEMQNSVVAGPLSLPIIVHFSSAPRNLPGCQWKQHDCRRALRLPSSVSLGESLPEDRHPAVFVVTAFFGGNKSPPVKSVSLPR